MPNTGTFAQWPLLGNALSAMGRVVRALLVLVLLVATTLLALSVAAVLVLRALFSRRPAGPGTGSPFGTPHGARRAATARASTAPGEVVDVDAREVMVHHKTGH